MLFVARSVLHVSLSTQVIEFVRRKFGVCDIWVKCPRYSSMQSNGGIGMVVVESAASFVWLDNRTDCACISKTAAGSMYVATITTRATIMTPPIFWTADTPAEHIVKMAQNKKWMRPRTAGREENTRKYFGAKPPRRNHHGLCPCKPHLTFCDQQWSMPSC